MTNVDKALLLAEWSVLVHHHDSKAIEVCPICLRILPTARSHDPECTMDLALSERGFYTQEERDGARHFILKGVATAPTLPPAEP
jgi:hypothetical protein